MTSFLAKEDKKVALDITIEDGAGSFLVKFNNQWQRFDLDELLQILDIEFFSEFRLLVIKVLEENDFAIFNAVLGKDIGVARDTKDLIVD